MTSPAGQMTPREQEASAADEAFQLALLYLGVETIEDALALWQSVPAGSAASTAATWLNQAVALVMSQRGQARELAIAYYRLTRALRTGKTVPDPRDPVPTQVTMQQLRFEFSQLVEGVDAAPETAVNTPTPKPPNRETPATSQADSAGSSDGDPDLLPEVDDDELIDIEDLDWDLIENEIVDDEEDEAADVLATLGPLNQERLTSKIDEDKPAKEVDVLRDAAHDKAGIRQASAAEHVVLNGARDTLYLAGGRDARVLGYVRRSRTGTPCGFCAMLISRGPELKDDKGDDIREAQIYVSKESATSGEDGQPFHHNCHCYAVPIYSTRQFQLDPAYNLNRQYAVEWPRVTAGLSGDDALRAWRNYIDAINRDAGKQAQTQLDANGQTVRTITPTRAQAA